MSVTTIKSWGERALNVLQSNGVRGLGFDAWKRAAQFPFSNERFDVIVRSLVDAKKVHLVGSVYRAGSFADGLRVAERAAHSQKKMQIKAHRRNVDFLRRLARHFESVAADVQSVIADYEKMIESCGGE